MNVLRKFLSPGCSQRTPRLAATVALAIVLLSPASLSAQSTVDRTPSSPTIQGIVRSATGEVVAGASVTLQENGHTNILKTMTASDGAFYFEPDHPGTFNLQAEKGEIGKAVADGVILLPAEKKHLELILQVANGQSQSPSSAPSMEFDDKPSFTVAGVTDTTAAGGHGSGEGLRTSETLAKATLSLKPGSDATIFSTSEAKPSSVHELTEARDRLQQMLVKQDSAETHRLLGEVYEQLNDPVAAVREYERATHLAPDEQNYFAWGAELLLHRAIVPALEVFRNGVKAHAGSARMLAGLGVSLYASGSVEEAAQRVCEATDLAPADTAAYYFLGQMQMASLLPLPCVEQRLARLAHDQPNNALGNYYYAVAIWKGEKGEGDTARWKQAQQALTLLEKATALDPKLGEACLQIGILYAARHDDVDAAAAFRKAIAATPDLAEAHYRLANTYKHMGDSTKAQQEIQVYKQLEQSKAEEEERKHRELQQFVVILKNEKPTTTQEPEPEKHQP